MKTVNPQDHPSGTAIGLNSQVTGLWAGSNGDGPGLPVGDACGNRPAGALPNLPTTS